MCMDTTQSDLETSRPSQRGLLYFTQPYSTKNGQYSMDFNSVALRMAKTLWTVALRMAKALWTLILLHVLAILSATGLKLQN